MTWHHALDVRSEADCYFCEKILRNYRRLFIAEGLDEVLFRRMTDRLVRAFSVDTSRQRMDSTALRSAMRSLMRLGIVVETISKFARELARFHPALHALIDGDIIRRYVDREGAGCFSNTAPSASRRRLDEAGRDLLQLVVQFRNTAAAALPGYALLDQVLHEQFEVTQEEQDDTSCAIATPRKPGEMPCDGISNPADPDASYNAHRGLGYMAQIVETYAEDDDPAREAASRASDLITPDLILHVAVHKMTVHDGHRLPGALDDLAGRALTPKVPLADSHYGSADNMTLAEMRSIDLTAPARTAKGGSAGRLTLEDFRPVWCWNAQAVSQRSRPLRQTRNCRRVLILPHAGNAPTGAAAQCRPTSTTGNSPAFNTRQHGQKTRNDDFTNAAKHSGKSIAGARA